MAAAGRGERAGLGEGEKLYQFLGDRPVLAHTLRVFQEDESVEEILLVVRPGDEGRCRDTVLRPYELTKVTALLPGGAHRQDSVYNGLGYMGGAADVVVIHDGARPLLSGELLRRVLEAGLREGAAVPAIPVKDTLKRVRGDRVLGTVERGEFVQVQTPQVFWYDLIWMAHCRAREAGVHASDDAALVELLRHPIQVVPGDERNLKLTTLFDFLVAAAMVEGRLGEQRGIPR